MREHSTNDEGEVTQCIPNPTGMGIEHMLAPADISAAVEPQL